MKIHKLQNWPINLLYAPVKNFYQCSLGTTILCKTSRTNIFERSETRSCMSAIKPFHLFLYCKNPFPMPTTSICRMIYNPTIPPLLCNMSAPISPKYYFFCGNCPYMLIQACCIQVFYISKA